MTSGGDSIRESRIANEAATTPGTGAGAATGSSEGRELLARIADKFTEGSTTRLMPLDELISFKLPTSAYTGRTAKGRARRN